MTLGLDGSAALALCTHPHTSLMRKATRSVGKAMVPTVNKMWSIVMWPRLTQNQCPNDSS